MSSIAARETIEKLVDVFGFPLDRSRQAVEAIGDKSDVQMAYNWLLDHGEDDRGGPVEIRICDHADHNDVRFVDLKSIADNDVFETDRRCAEGCPSGEVWMCLCCGEVRCSRYVNGHNIAHFKSTLADEEAALTVADASRGKVALGHFAAVGLRDLTVWCYHCSAYVTNPRFEALRQRLEKMKFGGKEDGGDDHSASSMELDSIPEADMKEGDLMRNVPWQSMHGFKGDPAWRSPSVARVCHAEARPGYQTMQAHEYLEDDDTLRAKVALLASWLRDAKAAIMYSGAGISTAAGVRDYASLAGNSLSGTSQKSSKRSPLMAAPTLSHCVVAQLHSAGLLSHWIQQNHDGLPQKAGFPQPSLNEIHGSWFDPSNPVVPMSGTLRDDLVEQLIEWEGKTDLCLAVGSSLCGMNADRVVTSAARRAKHGEGFGSVIISLQRTQLDSSASLRIFARSDDVFRLLASEMALPTRPIALDERILPPNDTFQGLPYSTRSGKKRLDASLTLDLRVGSEVRVTNQPEWDMKRRGNTALIVGKTSDEDYILDFGGHTRRTLGRWWLIHALRGEIPRIPVVNARGV